MKGVAFEMKINKVTKKKVNFHELVNMKLFPYVRIPTRPVRKFV